MITLAAVTRYSPPNTSHFKAHTKWVNLQFNLLSVVKMNERDREQMAAIQSPISIDLNTICYHVFAVITHLQHQTFSNN